MSVNDADNAGGYVSEEILASETDCDDLDGDVDHAVTKTLLHADDVLRALEKQIRKRVLPLSSDESEPDEGLSFHQRYPKKVASKPSAISPPQKLSKSLQTSRGKTPTAKTPNQWLSSDKTPGSGNSYSSGNKKSSARGVGKVDETPKSRFSITQKCPNPTPQASAVHNEDSGIMNTLKEISNTLHQVVRRLDRQESRMECVEKKINEQSTPSSSSSSAESSKVKVPRIIRVSDYTGKGTIMCLSINFCIFLYMYSLNCEACTGP